MSWFYCIVATQPYFAWFGKSGLDCVLGTLISMQKQQEFPYLETQEFTHHSKTQFWTRFLTEWQQHLPSSYLLYQEYFLHHCIIAPIITLIEITFSSDRRLSSLTGVEFRPRERPTFHPKDPLFYPQKHCNSCFFFSVTVASICITLMLIVCTHKCLVSVRFCQSTLRWWL